MHAAVGGASNGGAHRVGDAHAQRAPPLGILQCCQGVRRLARLRKVGGGGRHTKVSRAVGGARPAPWHTAALISEGRNINKTSLACDTKTQVSSRKMGHRRSSRSEASSQATGRLTSSSTVCLQRDGGTETNGLPARPDQQVRGSSQAIGAWARSHHLPAQGQGRMTTAERLSRQTGSQRSGRPAGVAARQAPKPRPSFPPSCLAASEAWCEVPQATNTTRRPQRIVSTCSASPPCAAQQGVA